MSLITCYLTCADNREAQEIAMELLEKRLAACVKRTKVGTSYWWGPEIESTNEVLLLIETQKEHFGDIENVVKRLHSYELPVLLAYDVALSSAGVDKWVGDNTK